ncbi:Endonuclease, Uma2 family [Nostoc flagelliforme CCNUN1]|uniref:Endonuclease, Uma2 family n=1 Tax=Nostoc flagelliforme CCNUN1 TaxID=2038116 RepID=A0A2K8SLP0_9NOSO|nr:Uma2 family endonuclease [Nostoc flagelliforme]AUB36327.1 Endonuclease, Uma2 family [Nostoc flagelliforme CCNUN1]
MTIITGKRLTLEEYLKYDDRTDSQYELVAGELVAMPPESPKNVQIPLFCHSPKTFAISEF